MHPIDRFTADWVRAAPALDAARSVENDTPFIGETFAYLSWDTTEGQVDAQITSPADGLFALSLDVSGAPRWFTLNLPLGPGRIAADDVVGVVLDMEGCIARTAPFLRSRTEKSDNGVTDTVFDPGLEANGVRQVQTLLHRVVAGDGVTEGDDFHTLIIPLAPRNQRISVFGLDCFVSGPRAV